MIQHIVAWDCADGFTEAEKAANAQRAKTELEALRGVIGGVIELTVYINLLPSSNRDIVLFSTFDSIESLQAYQVHPAHKQAAEFVGSVTQNRTCLDYAL